MADRTKGCFGMPRNSGQLHAIKPMFRMILCMVVHLKSRKLKRRLFIFLSPETSDFTLDDALTYSKQNQLFSSRVKSASKGFHPNSAMITIWNKDMVLETSAFLVTFVRRCFQLQICSPFTSVYIRTTGLLNVHNVEKDTNTKKTSKHIAVDSHVVSSYKTVKKWIHGDLYQIFFPKILCLVWFVNCINWALNLNTYDPFQCFTVFCKCVKDNFFCGH